MSHKCSNCGQMCHPFCGTTENEGHGGGVTCPSCVSSSSSSSPPGQVSAGDPIRSRCLKDVFHIMQKPYLPKKHGAYLQFYWDFVDAVFVPNADDVREVLGVLRQGGSRVTLEDVKHNRRRYYAKRIRR
jgi:hypothetical protein